VAVVVSGGGGSGDDEKRLARARFRALATRGKENKPHGMRRETVVAMSSVGQRWRRGDTRRRKSNI